jgi:S1-C subfamily serine protease
VTSVDDLHDLINGPDTEESVTLGVVRGAEELSVSVSFAAAPEEPSAP